MRKQETPYESGAPPRRHPRSLARAAIGVTVTALTLAAFAGLIGAPLAAGKATKTVVKEVKIKGRTILTTNRGHALYSLSVESHGKFVCTMSSGCLSVWHPLTVPAGVTPKGPVKLGTVRRPEGDTQVTFRGHPLYSFNGDTKSGQLNGEGVKDVGTWHAASP